MIVFAVNIHSGGGKVLLDTLLEDQPFGPITHALVDARYEPKSTLQGIELLPYLPTITNRLKAHWHLKKISRQHPNEDILFFGNQPPFFKLKNKTIVYLQNCFLLSGVPLPKDSFKEMLRNYVERLILRFFKSNVSEIWVQTEWMQQLVHHDFPRILAHKKPFLPSLPPARSEKSASAENDFLIVTSRSSHKNLNAAVSALKALASEPNTPHEIRCSIVFAGDAPESLLKENQSSNGSLKLFIKNDLSREELLKEFESHKVLLAPNLFESMCLPVYEALHFNLKVLANDIPVFRELKPNVATVDFSDQAATVNALRASLALRQ